MLFGLVNPVSFLLYPFLLNVLCNRHVEFIQNPRLRVAMAQENMDFVGHMFCQQMLRQQWHGGVQWLGKTLAYRVVYILIQV